MGVFSSCWFWAAQKIVPHFGIDMNEKKIGGLPTTGYPEENDEAATKKYVDDKFLPSIWLDSFEYATNALIQAAYVSSDTGYVNDDPTAGMFTQSGLGWYGGSPLIDNDTTTEAFHTDSSGPGSWFKIDLGAGNEKGFIKARIFGADAAGNPANVYAVWNIQYSDNDSDWNTAYTGLGGHPFSGWAEATWATVGQHRYWRFYKTDAAAPGSYHNELEMYVPALQCYSEASIKTQGFYALKGRATYNFSLNDTLTRIISPTIDLSNKITIKFAIRASWTGSLIKIGIRDSGAAVTEITPNITQPNVWQNVNWDISGVSNANKDAIDRIIITVVNAGVAINFHLDNMRCEGGGVTRLIDLEDCPITLSGQANKVLAVKGDESGLEFISVGAGGDMLKSVYDPDDDGIVKDSDKLEGSTKGEVRYHDPKAHTHDHGSEITGLGDDDHTQYLTTVMLGVWTAKSLATIYQAGDDGFVICCQYGATGPYTHVDTLGYTDAAASPTILRAKNSMYLDNWKGAGALTFCMPVRKNHYWKVTKAIYNSDVTVKLYWVQLDKN